MTDAHAKPRIGRPPKSPEGPATRNLTFRTRDSLRGKLMEAAAVTGRSISEEIEHRLDKSFDREALSKHIDNLLAESLTRAEEVGEARNKLAVADARITELEARVVELEKRLQEATERQLVAA